MELDLYYSSKENAVRAESVHALSEIPYFGRNWLLQKKANRKGINNIIENISERIKKGTKQPEDYANLALACLLRNSTMRGDLRKAGESAKKAITENSNSALSHLSFGHTLIRTSLEGAINEIKQAVKLDPSLSAAHLDLGLLYLFPDFPMFNLSLAYDHLTTAAKSSHFFTRAIAKKLLKDPYIK